MNEIIRYKKRLIKVQKRFNRNELNQEEIDVENEHFNNLLEKILDKARFNGYDENKYNLMKNEISNIKNILKEPHTESDSKDIFTSLINTFERMGFMK